MGVIKFGERVRVLNGAYKGATGRIVSLKNERASILLDNNDIAPVGKFALWDLELLEEREYENKFHPGDIVEEKNSRQRGEVELVRGDEVFVKLFDPKFATRYYSNQLKLLAKRSNVTKNVVIDGVEYAPKQEKECVLHTVKIGDVVESQESMSSLGVEEGDRGVVIDVLEDGFHVVFVSRDFLSRNFNEGAFFHKENIDKLLHFCKTDEKYA